MNTTNQKHASELTKLGLSAKEAAHLLGVSTRHIWAMHSAGKVPKPIRLGRAVKWLRSELESWLAAGAPSREQWETMKRADR